MSEHDHHPDAGLDPEPGPGPGHEHDGDEGEREPGHVPKKKAVRFPFAHRSAAGAARWKRETRFGVAALLSFVILVTVLLINKDARRDRKVVMQVPPSEGSLADSSKPAPKPDKNPDKGGDPPPPSPTQPKPELPPPVPTHIAKPDDKVREAGSESVPQPATEKRGDPSLPPLAGTTPPDKTGMDGPKGPEPGDPLPAAMPLTPATNEPSKDPVAPPVPAPVAESSGPPSGGSVAPPPSPPPSPGATDLAGPVEPQGAAGSNEGATPPAPPPDMKPDLALPGAEPGSNAGSTPAPPVEQPPAPAPTPTEPPAPMPTPPQDQTQTPPPTPTPPPQGEAAAQTSPQTPAPSPAESQTPAQTPAPSHAESQTPAPSRAEAPVPAPTPAPPHAEAPAQAQTPAPPHAEAPTQPQAPAPHPTESPSPAVGPGEVPNFDRAPSSDDSIISSSAPPELKPGQGIPIPNAGKGRSLDEEVPEKVASVAAAATGIASAAKAVEKAQLAPELHVVESGENFWTISRHYYSSGRYYMALWKANSRTVPAADKLMVGQTIIIPPPEALDRSQIEPPRVGTGSSSSRAGAPVRRTSRSKPNADDPADTPVRRSSEVELILPIDNSVLDRRSRSGASEELDPPPEKRYRAARPRYKVRAHETLRSIARDTLNDKRRADEIYELNRDILGNDPYKMLVEGQILELPEDARSGRRSR